MLTTAQVASFNAKAPYDGPAANVSGLGSLLNQKRGVIKAYWDFAVQGGAIGVINLLDPVSGLPVILPNKAIVTQVYCDTVTAVTTSASGTLSIDANSTADMKAALAAASWTGIQAGVPVGTAATMVKMTAARTLTATIATGALTAGKINVFVEFVFSD